MKSSTSGSFIKIMINEALLYDHYGKNYDSDVDSGIIICGGLWTHEYYHLIQHAYPSAAVVGLYFQRIPHQYPHWEVVDGIGSLTPLIVIGLVTKFCVRVVCPSECGLVLITPPPMVYSVTISKGYLSPIQFQDESVSTRFSAEEPTMLKVSVAERIVSGENNPAPEPSDQYALTNITRV